jgi:ferredoxin
VYDGCHMDEVARQTGLALNFDLSDAEVPCPAAKYLRRVRIIKPLLEADLIINLPKLKTHGQIVYTGAVKNMFGAVPGTLKMEYHMTMRTADRFADALIDIFLAAPPALTIMDAVVGMDGLGPAAGDLKPIGLVLAGEDAFALDLTALAVIRADPAAVPLIRAAMDRKLCPTSLDDVEMVGNALADVRVKGFHMPQHDALQGTSFADGRVRNWLAAITKPKPVFLHRRCTSCGECMRLCPAHVITMPGRKPRADLGGCIRCFCCQELCPSKAVAIRSLPRWLSPPMRILVFALAMLSENRKAKRKGQ